MLREIADAPAATVLRDEVDRDGAFVHRILSIVADSSRHGSYRELVMPFGDIDSARVPRPGRDVDPIGSRHVQVGKGIV